MSCPDDTATVWPAPSWDELATAWSPRPYVRVDPELSHAYVRRHRLDAGAPPSGVPYAVPLTDVDGRYRLLAFDFDAHTSGTAETARREAAQLSQVLAEANLAHLVCLSGPGGGVHVWLRLNAAAPARRVADLADLLSTAFSSLDTGALRNPVTGCVRAPGSPHRLGGISRPLGDTAITAVRPAELFETLTEHFTHTHPAPTTNNQSTSSITVAMDPAGDPLLPGPKRPLAPCHVALARRPLDAAEDASSRAWSLLLACAHARWTFTDLHNAAFDERWPGLEYLRTTRTDTSSRTPRTPGAALELARRQWARAVAAAATTPTRPATASPERKHVQALIAEYLSAVDAHPDRWRGKTGAQDRLLLLALATRMHAAAREVVHLSERDWALTAGCTRDVVNDRLPALLQEGWLARPQRSAGPWAATWTLHVPGGGKQRSGAVFSEPRWKEVLGELAVAREDIWHAGGLGVLGLRLWQHLCACRGRGGARAAARALGVTVATVRTKWRALRTVGLVNARGHAYTGAGRLAAAARTAGVTGAHADRMRLYQLQSAVFVWWFTARYAPGASDALAEWGPFPTPSAAAEVHPVDIALTYGAASLGPPPEATVWAAAMVAQDAHRHLDPESWRSLVAESRAALPAPEMLVSAYRVGTTAA